MALQAPVVAGTTLASCSAYDQTDTLRSSTVELADGSVHFELVATGAKKDFVLGWDMLTAAQMADVRTAWVALATAYSSNNFVSVLGDTYTVTRHPDQKELKFTAVHVNGVLLRYKGELRLREV
jgi:hypothetical protein